MPDQTWRHDGHRSCFWKKWGFCRVRDTIFDKDLAGALKRTWYGLAVLAVPLLAGFAGIGPAGAAPPDSPATHRARLMDILVAAYPDHLKGHDGRHIIWRDGTRMRFDDGRSGKTFDQLIAAPDLEDQFYAPYPIGAAMARPHLNIDPGRVRYGPFFKKMYGDCKRASIRGKFARVVWLPKHWGKLVWATRVNGIAAKLQKISDELDRLPKKYMRFLMPARGQDRKFVPGIYSCRCIRGTTRYSVHAYGAAIDLVYDNYWQARFRPGGRRQRGTTDCRGKQPAFLHRHTGKYFHRHKYRNTMPRAIVRIFEAHGFIWGGAWYHYDTMHFEYRPELIAAAKAGVP